MKCKATRRGDVELTLDDAEADLLRGLPEQLRELYEAPAGDPARDRLFPRAYLDPTEDRAEQEWQALTHPGILRDRFDALDRLLATLDAAEPRRGGLRCTLTPEQAAVWAQILNDARLALGTRLGITEESELRLLGRDDPEAFAKAAYGWLTALQGALVEALLGSLPD